MVLSILIEFLGSFNKAVLEWLNRSDVHRDAEKLAVTSLLEALGRTHVYLAKFDRGESVDHGTQDELSRLWMVAAGQFYGIDSKLAPLLEQKAELWARPEDWSTERCQAAGIEIAQVPENARCLLANA